MALRDSLSKLADAATMELLTKLTDEMVAPIARTVSGKALETEIVTAIKSDPTKLTLLQSRIEVTAIAAAAATAGDIAAGAMGTAPGAENVSCSDDVNVGLAMRRVIIDSPYGRAGPALTIIIIVIGFFVILGMVASDSFAMALAGKEGGRDLVLVMVGTMASAFTQS